VISQLEECSRRVPSLSLSLSLFLLWTSPSASTTADSRDGQIVTEFGPSCHQVGSRRLVGGALEVRQTELNTPFFPSLGEELLLFSVQVLSSSVLIWLIREI